MVGDIETNTKVGDVTKMYTKVFTRKKRTLDKSDQQTDALVRDKRIKKASKLVSSPYTTGAKWRRHVDNTKVDLFRDVDQVKKKHFFKWYSSLEDGASYKLGHINLEDAKTWFNDVLNPGGWFRDEHVDMALHLLWARAKKYPKSFGGSRAILDMQFNNELIFAMIDFHKQGDHFKIPVELMKYVNGANPSFGSKWQECTHIYFPLCTRNHWVAVEIDIFKATIYVYDPDKSCITNDQLKDDLKAASIILPLLLKEINIDLGVYIVAIERSIKTTKQAISEKVFIVISNSYE
ncbi:hypothetical protein DH2020_012079 [Rehmannia glutinosa]|uniref:Ubiquitin-like protease family profile domain-containing protein n=1 Tax=Rehmannia glutinosa TaxID=99300 RepID=A0ABR0XFU5_REHGL